MPNLTPILIATVRDFGKREPVSRVILNPFDASKLQVGSDFTREVPDGCLIGSAIGVLKGRILVLAWSMIPQGQVSVLEGGDLGMYGPLDSLQPDPHFITHLRYGEEPLYELSEEVLVTRNSKEGSWGPIYGILNVSIHKDTRLSSIRTHHLNVIEGPMPPDILTQLPGIHYWISSVEFWIPEDSISPVTTQSLSTEASPVV
jgi:hypothetical protein